LELIERSVRGPTHSDGALLLRLLQYGNGLPRTDFAQGLDGSLRDKGIVRLDDYRHQIWDAGGLLPLAENPCSTNSCLRLRMVQRRA